MSHSRHSQVPIAIDHMCPELVRKGLVNRCVLTFRPRMKRPRIIRHYKIIMEQEFPKRQHYSTVLTRARWYGTLHKGQKLNCSKKKQLSRQLQFLQYSQTFLDMPAFLTLQLIFLDMTAIQAVAVAILRYDSYLGSCSCYSQI